MDDGCWTSFIRSHNNLPQVENGLIAHCPRASSLRLCARVSPGLVPKKFNLQPLPCVAMDCDVPVAYGAMMFQKDAISYLCIVVGLLVRMRCECAMRV